MEKDWIVLWILLLRFFSQRVEGLDDNRTNKTQDGENLLCERTEKYKENVTVSHSKLERVPHQTWCFSLPDFQCTEYETRTVHFFTIETVTKTRKVLDCCEGFKKIEDVCKPVCPDGCVHGMCAKPGKCFCLAGWTDDDCSKGICPNGCVHGTCAEPRKCVCDAGWTNDDCSKAICTACVHGTCDEPGKCICDAGWTYDDCSKECENNFYGVDCKSPCRCENGATCNKVDGSCICRSEYKGKYCEERCDKGFFGKNCEQECACPEHVICDPKEGDCKCVPEYDRINCIVECEDGTVAKNCSNICECNKTTTNYCNIEDGYCRCIPGYKGKSCNEICDPGFWGENCSYNCDCDGNSCNPVSGMCLLKIPNSDRVEQKTVVPLNLTAKIGIGVLFGVLFLLMATLLILCCLQKKKQKHKKKDIEYSVTWKKNVDVNSTVSSECNLFSGTRGSYTNQTYNVPGNDPPPFPVLIDQNGDSGNVELIQVNLDDVFKDIMDKNFNLNDTENEKKEDTNFKKSNIYSSIRDREPVTFAVKDGDKFKRSSSTRSSIYQDVQVLLMAPEEKNKEDKEDTEDVEKKE